MKKRIVLIALLTMVLSVGTTLLIGHFVWNKTAGTSVLSNSGDETRPIVHNVTLPDKDYPDFTFAAETAVKSVVHVKVTIQSQSQAPQSFFDYFFGYGNPNVQPREQVGSGSGVIISEDGYIVTNNHVVEGADEVLVTLDNNQEYEGTVIGTDPVTDVALIKIDAKNLPYMTFGNSDDLRLGQWVLAIGNPYNLRSTITAGIVSAKSRSLPSYTGEFKIEAFIQTDAAVNPGNSGGALVNESGELVGINTAIASSTGAYSGYSFAVPATIVRKVVNDIREYGAVQRALLGISMQNMTGDLAKEKGMDKVKGVYVADLTEGGAAQHAGIKVGDVVIKINDTDVNSSTAVQEIISRFSPGEKISVTVLRDNDTKVFKDITLQNQSGNTEIVKAGEGDVSNFLGAQLRPVGKELKDKLKIRSGLEVISVGEGKIRDAGIQKGFVITHVNQKALTTVQELAMAVQNSQRGALIEGKYPDGSTYYYALGH